MRTTVGAILGKSLYAFIYGQTGCGKTTLPMTLAQKSDGSDVGYITAERNGPTALATQGFTNVPVEVLPTAGHDPFEPTIAALRSFRADKNINTIVLDGLSVISGRAIEHLSDGEGEKALGYPGWQEILANFRRVEGECEMTTRAGKSVILTAWEDEPQYEESMGGAALKSVGRPLLQGKARVWLPGNCDIICRMTSKYTKAAVNGKPGMVWNGFLHLKPTNDWLGKTRWDFLQSPYPADLRKMLNDVVAWSKKGPAPVKTVAAPMKK